MHNLFGTEKERNQLKHDDVKENILAKEFKLEHPCTVVLSGPSGCDKTVLTRNVLSREIMHPPPQRVIWCYGQYQPLYDEIRRDMPHVEFIKGIPETVEDDHYLKSGVRNCLILDDLMGDAKKDERVANLFTRGSHHKNLSVLYLTQNLFPQGKACRDICLNTKYLVLFNNPVDRNQVALLSRRIYPDNSQSFMKIYNGAVQKPFGHLLIDLRANVKEADRLLPNVLASSDSLRVSDDITCGHCDLVFGDIVAFQDHKRIGCRMVNTSFRVPETVAWKNESSQPTSEETSNDTPIPITQSKCIIDDAVTMSCDSCGIVLSDIHNLQTHVKDWCPARSLKRKREDISENRDTPPLKKWITDQSDPIRQERTAFRNLMKVSKMDNEAEWSELVNKYENKGMKEEEAKTKVEAKLKAKDMNGFFKNYGNVLYYLLDLRNGTVHKKIMERVEDFIKDGYDAKRAISMSLKKYKGYIEATLESSDNEDDDDDDDDDDKSDNDDE